MRDGVPGMGAGQVGDGGLSHAMVKLELDALAADTETYLTRAALIDLLEFLWAFLALPMLTGVLFLEGHPTLGKWTAVVAAVEERII